MGRLMTGGYFMASSQQNPAGELQCTRIMLPPRPALLAQGRAADLCNFKDDLKGYTSSRCSAHTIGHATTWVTPSQNAYTRCLAAACLSLKPKPSSFTSARCHTSQVWGALPSKRCHIREPVLLIVCHVFSSPRACSLNRAIPVSISLL